MKSENEILREVKAEIRKANVCDDCKLLAANILCANNFASVRTLMENFGGGLDEIEAQQQMQDGCRSAEEWDLRPLVIYANAVVASQNSHSPNAPYNWYAKALVEFLEGKWATWYQEDEIDGLGQRRTYYRVREWEPGDPLGYHC